MNHEKKQRPRPIYEMPASLSQENVWRVAKAEMALPSPAAVLAEAETILRRPL